MAKIPEPLRQAAGVIGRSMREGMKGRNYLLHLALNGADRYFDACVLFRNVEKESLFTTEVQREIQGRDSLAYWRGFLQKSRMHWLSALQYLDIKNYLPNDIMTKVDRMS